MNRFWCSLAGLLLGACASVPPLDTTYRSVSQDSRVQFLVLHFTSSDFPNALETLTEGAVSSHYLVLSRQWRHDGGNGDSGYGTHKGYFNAWGLGNQHFVDLSGPGFGDRLVDGGGLTATGHLGDAYGLRAAFVFDRATKNGMIFLAGGTGFDPDTDRGAYSAASRFEERILTALYRRAIQGKADW